MDNWIVDNQYWLRFVIFLLVFAVLAWWETAQAWRPWLTPRLTRWIRNGGLSLISKIILRLIFPLFTVGVAVLVNEKKMGFLTNTLLPQWAKVILGLIALDFVIYLQHRFMHKYTWFWFFHKVHHVDNHVDVSTGLRFHPLEELYTMAAKILAVGIFGVPVLAAFLYEIWLNTASLFTHTDIKLSPRLEKWLRYVIVTPSMHVIHHSDIPAETNSNYGFGLSVWDKLFASYKPYSSVREDKLLIGLEQYREPKYQTLENMLLLPFGGRKLKVWPKKVMRTKKKD